MTDKRFEIAVHRALEALSNELPYTEHGRPELDAAIGAVEDIILAKYGDVIYDLDLDEEREVACACAKCSKPIYKDELRPNGPIRENKVFEFDGTLDYIELFHAACK